MREPNGPQPTQLIHVGLQRRLVAGGLAWVAAGLRAWRRLSAAKQAPRRQQAVLILEPFGLGDVISLEPLVRQLLQRGYELTLCARGEWQPLYPQVKQWVLAAVPWARHHSADKYRLADYRQPQFRQFLHQLRAAAQGTIGLEVRGDIRSVLLLHLAGCRKVVTLSNYLGSDLRVPAWAAERVAFCPALRRWELNLRFLPALAGGEAPETQPPQFPHLAGAETAPTSRRVGLVPVAPWPGKLWSADKWQDLALGLQGLGWEVQAFCGPGQAETAAQATGCRVSVVQCDSVWAWAEALRRCAVVVTLDTGPMHLADALGVPVVALFGQGLLPLWAPSGPRSRVITHRDQDFVPCHPTEANVPLGQKYMDRIGVAEVIEAVQAVAQVR